MEEKDKIKVVWVANFSNEEVRKHLEFRIPLIERVIRKLTKKDYKLPADNGQWVINGIKEFEKFDDVELHVIASARDLSKREVVFEIKGVHYYIFRDEFGSGLEILKRNLNPAYSCNYKKNRKYIEKKIKEIMPDIVQVIGAENPAYSLAMLDMPSSIPTIIQLQTLLAAPSFRGNYPMSNSEYQARSQCERDVICRADYVGTGGVKFLPVIRNDIKQDIIALTMPLALAEQINTHQDEKEFDVVYFAKNISKAADWAVEAFCRVCKTHPGLTFHIIGEYGTVYKEQLLRRLQESNVAENVTFEGELPTHEDVIRQIRKARVALLPLKVDLVSGTIREAMCNGIPVVTTVTPGTPGLNANRDSVLLSEKEDFDGMAANIIKVLDDDRTASTLISNAAETMRERADNYSRMRTSVAVYRACIEHFKNGTPIPSELLRP